MGDTNRDHDKVNHLQLCVNIPGDTVGLLHMNCWVSAFIFKQNPSNCLYFEEISGRNSSVPAMPARLLSFCWNLRPHEAHVAHGCSQCGDAFCHVMQLPMTFSCYSDKWFSFATKVAVESRWVRNNGGCKKMRALCFEVGFQSRTLWEHPHSQIASQQFVLAKWLCF